MLVNLAKLSYDLVWHAVCYFNPLTLGASQFLSQNNDNTIERLTPPCIWMVKRGFYPQTKKLRTTLYDSITPYIIVIRYLVCLIYFLLKGSPEKAAQLYKRANDIRENEPHHGLSRRSSLSVLSNGSARKHSQAPQMHDSVSRVIALWWNRLIPLQQFWNDLW